MLKYFIVGDVHYPVIRVSLNPIVKMRPVSFRKLDCSIILFNLFLSFILFTSKVRDDSPNELQFLNELNTREPENQ